MYDEDDEDDINLRISWKLGLGGIGNINDLSGWHPTRGFAKRNRGKKEETEETELPTFPKFDELNLNKPLHIVAETGNLINTYTTGLLKKEKAFQTVDTNATFTTTAKMVHHHLKPMICLGGPRGFAKRNGKKEKKEETELPTFPNFDRLNLKKPV